MNLSKLPSAARAVIQFEISKAELVFCSGSPSWASLTDGPYEWPTELQGESKRLDRLEVLALDYLCTVFFAVAYGFCEAAGDDDSTLTSSDIRSDLKQIRSDLEHEVFSAKWPKRSFYYPKFVPLEQDQKKFSLQSSYWIEQDDRWIALQKDLANLAEWEMSPDIEPDMQPVPSKDERQALVAECKAECKKRKKRYTHEQLAKFADDNWTSRTQIDKWLQCDPRYDGEVDMRIRAALKNFPLS